MTSVSVLAVCRLAAKRKCQHSKKKPDGSTSADASLVECVMCVKHIHDRCYRVEVLNAKGINFDDEAEEKWVTKSDDEAEVHPYVCGIQCYKRLVSARQKQKATDLRDTKKRWDRDSAPGSSNTSISILIDWMTTEGNYNAYRGDVVMGKTRDRICNDVAESINKSGVLTTRTGPQVECKIRKLESEFKHALAFFSETGQGLEGNDGRKLNKDDKGNHPQSVKDLILRRCQYYYELEPVFRHRPNFEALSIFSSQDPNNNGDEEGTVDDSDDELDDDDDDDDGNKDGGGTVDDVVEEEVGSGRASFLGSLNESSDEEGTVESRGTMTSKESTNAGSRRSTLLMVSKTPKKTNTKKAATVRSKPRALESGKCRWKKGEFSSIVDLTGGTVDSVVRFRHKELKETKKHRKRELTLKASVTMDKKKKLRVEIKKLKTETEILDIERYNCHGAAVILRQKRIKCMVDDLGISRDDAIQTLGPLPDIRMDEDIRIDEDYNDLDIVTLLQSDEGEED